MGGEDIARNYTLNFGRQLLDLSVESLWKVQVFLAASLLTALEKIASL